MTCLPYSGLQRENAYTTSSINCLLWCECWKFWLRVVFSSTGSPWENCQAATDYGKKKTPPTNAWTRIPLLQHGRGLLNSPCTHLLLQPLTLPACENVLFAPQVQAVHTRHSFAYPFTLFAYLFTLSVSWGHCCQGQLWQCSLCLLGQKPHGRCGQAGCSPRHQTSLQEQADGPALSGGRLIRHLPSQPMASPDAQNSETTMCWAGNEFHKPSSENLLSFLNFTIP